MGRELEFTASSFLQIATLEARRGRDDPGQMFPQVNAVINDLKDLHKQRRESSRAEPSWERQRAVYGTFRKQIAGLQTKKRKALEESLQQVSSDLSRALGDGTFEWGLARGPLRGTRETYQVAGGPERYFSMKQLEINLRSAHQLTAPNRNRLIAQLRDSLEGKLPRYVIRTDIASFYESVPHAALTDLLARHGGLSKTSMRLVRQLLDEWTTITGRNTGIPTGVGLSANLAEVYARQIDAAFAGDPSVHFYGRYVDDIVLVARTEAQRNDSECRLTARAAELGLVLNVSKTQRLSPSAFGGAVKKDPFDIARPIEFLGYALARTSGTVSVEMSTATIARYKQRLQAAFAGWAAVAQPNTGSDGLLLDRVRFLAGNTKLTNSKGRAVTGIYFNYPELSKSAVSLATLDSELRSLITANAASLSLGLQTRLNRVSFAQGHAQRTYHRFRQPDLERLVAVWRG